MGIYRVVLTASKLRAKDLKIGDKEAAEMWRRIRDSDPLVGQKDRERLWGKDYKLYRDYIAKAIEVLK